jgi:hypothetical protein
VNPFECSDIDLPETYPPVHPTDLHILAHSLKQCNQPSVRFWNCSGILFGRCKDHSLDDNEVVQRITNQDFNYQELTYEEVLIAQVMVA